MSRSRTDQRLVLALFYASIAAEVVAWIAFAMVIVIVASLLNPQLAHGGPIEDRWPHDLAAPSAFDAASFVNVWAAADEPPPTPPKPVPLQPPMPTLKPPAQSHPIICASGPDKSTVRWMWREIDGRRCWYVGTALVDKSRLRWPRAPVHVDPVPAKNTYAAHGGGQVRRVGHYPHGTPECCW